MRAARLEIVIDELVVRGLAPEAASAASAALERRLVALGAGARAEAVSERTEAFRRLDAIDAPADSPAALGEGVAGAVWGAVSGGGE